MSNHFSHYFKELFLCCRFINLMNAQVHSTSIAADYKEELLKNYFPKIQYFILYVYTIVHVLWKIFLQGCHGILTVTNAFLRSTRGVKLHSYGLLKAINGGLAESPWRAKIFTLHTLCAQSVYRVYKKFMWHSGLREVSGQAQSTYNCVYTAIMCVTWARERSYIFSFRCGVWYLNYALPLCQHDSIPFLLRVIKTQSCDAYFVHAQSVRRRMALYATLLRQV